MKKCGFCKGKGYVETPRPGFNYISCPKCCRIGDIITAEPWTTFDLKKEYDDIPWMAIIDRGKEEDNSVAT
jgi:hypothetical protein